MTLRFDPCCDEPIVRLLGNALSEYELAEFEQHLEHCSHCTERLAMLSADDDFWNDTHSFLSSVDQLPALDAPTISYVVNATNTHELPDLATSDIPLQPTDDPQMLGRFGGYEICGVIGRGGMGVVLKGWDRSLDRFVAIKVLSPTFSHQSAARQRFAREAKAAAAVVHDNVVAIFGVDHCQGLPYLVMPYIKGESLERRINREAPLAVEEILEISVQIARGLQAAHDQGVIHRDIKPANILLPQSVSRVLITDFGLARAANDATLTQSGTVAGTPAYMSPEQARGDSVDASSDLFSLGSVMYAMVCGYPPFRAESSYGILRRIIDEPHRPLQQIRTDIPRWFHAIVNRLLAKKPYNRFATAAELAEHLELCLAHVRQPTANPLPKMQTTRRRWLAAATVIALAISAIAAWNQIIDRPETRATTGLIANSSNETVWSDIDDELGQLEILLNQIDKELGE